MKQCIISEQLKEVDVKILEDIFKKHYHYDGIENEQFWIEGRYIHTENLKCAFGNFASALTIGKMIEILRNKHTLVSIYSDESDNGDYGWWCVDCGEILGDLNEYKSKELVDALWEAVKEAL